MIMSEITWIIIECWPPGSGQKMAKTSKNLIQLNGEILSKIISEHNYYFIFEIDCKLNNAYRCLH